MNEYNKHSVKNIIISVLLISLLPVLVVADPVFKDEFLCIDTTVGTDWSVRLPKVSLTGINTLIQVNLYDTLSSPWDSYLMKGFNIFDTDGNQLQPYEFITPFIVNDTVKSAGCLSVPSSNENGFTVIPSQANSNEHYIFIIDSVGEVIQPPKCLNCDNPDINNHHNDIAYASINNNTKVGLVWYVFKQLEVSPPNYEDSVFVRIYDFVTDSISPNINPLSLPLPEIDEPGYYGDYKPYAQPKIGIADDGSFAVVWVIWGDDFRHIFYVVYNADYTPRSEVQMADCSNNWSDSANCTAVEANFLVIAMESDGNFYIAWDVTQHTPYADVRHHIWVRGFNPDGTPKYDPVRVNDSDSLWLLIGEELFPAIACDDYGNVVVGWTDARDYPGNYLWKPRNLYIQKIDPNGNLIGYNTRVNNYNGASQSYWNSLGLNNSGQVMISWDYPFDSLNRVVAELIPLTDVGTFIPGDVTYDRSADISDLVAVVNYMFGGAINSFWPRSLTDFDGSGVTDIGDLVYLVTYMFAGGDTPITPDEGIRPNPGKFDLGG